MCLEKLDLCRAFDKIHFQVVALGEGAAELHGVAVSFLNKCFMMFMMYDSHFQKLYKLNDLQIMFQIGDLTVSEQIVPCQDCKLVFTF